MLKEIDIAEPIWKSRSVGLAVDDVPIGESVKITISYRKKKTGELSYPGEYIVNVNEIRQYPIQIIKGVSVHIVPIKDLASKTVINNQQNKTPMLYSQDNLNQIIAKSDEDKNANGGGSKKQIEPGKHIMTLIDVQLTKAAKDQNPMIVVEFALSDEYRTIKDFYKISGPNTDIPREKLVRLFHRGFGYAIQPCNTEVDLINQLVKFKGKKLTVAVQGQKKAFSFKDDQQNDVVTETTFAQFWYCGLESEFDSFYVDMEKAVKELSDEDKQKLVAFAELNGGPYVPGTAKKTTATDVPAGNGTGKDPIANADQKPPVKIETVPEAVNQTEPVPTQNPSPEAEKNDDFPF